jgi:hypothetical protein
VIIAASPSVNDLPELARPRKQAQGHHPNCRAVPGNRQLRVSDGNPHRATG